MFIRGKTLYSSIIFNLISIRLADIPASNIALLWFSASHTDYIES